MYPYVLAALFAVAKIWRQPRCASVDKWIKTLWYVNTIECYLAIKKEVNLTICET